MSWSSRGKKENIFYTVYFIRRKIFKEIEHLCFISMYSVLNILSEYTYFTYQKIILHTLFCLFLKLPKGFSVSLSYPSPVPYSRFLKVQFQLFIYIKLQYILNIYINHFDKQKTLKKNKRKDVQKKKLIDAQCESNINTLLLKNRFGYLARYVLLISLLSMMDEVYHQPFLKKLSNNLGVTQ